MFFHGVTRLRMAIAKRDQRSISFNDIKGEVLRSRLLACFMFFGGGKEGRYLEESLDYIQNEGKGNRLVLPELYDALSTNQAIHASYSAIFKLAQVGQNSLFGLPHSWTSRTIGIPKNYFNKKNMFFFFFNPGKIHCFSYRPPFVLKKCSKKTLYKLKTIIDHLNKNAKKTPSKTVCS